MTRTLSPMRRAAFAGVLWILGCQGGESEGPLRVAEALDLLGVPIDWVSLDGMAVAGPQEHRLTVRAVTDAGGPRWQLDLPVQEIHRLERVTLDVQTADATTLRVGWVETGDSALRLSPLTLAAGGPSPLVFEPRWELPGARLVKALVLVAPPGCDLQIQGATLIAREASGSGWVSLDDQARRSLVLRPPQAAQWRLIVPDQARLEFSFAVEASAWEGPGDGSFFQVDVLRSGQPARTLWQQVVDPIGDRSQRRWFGASIDLGEFAGEAVTLRLAARGSPPREAPFTTFEDTRNDQPVYGAPKIVTSGLPTPNVLIVLVDTLRRDEVGATQPDLSPALDRLLSTSTVFDRAYAAGPWTHPSTASLLTGLLPPGHGLGTSASGISAWRPGVPLLAQAFQEAGYATAAVSNNLIVSPDEGFARGIDSFDTRPFVASQVYGAERVTKFALQWLDEPREGPFFLYLHYFDPHDRYQAPAPHTRAFVDEATIAAVDDATVLAGQVNPLRTRMYRDGRPTGDEPTAAETACLRGLYRGEVQYAGVWIGRLLDHLQARGLLDDTVVVFTADHGEEFLDHGYLKHGQGLYDELIGVPLSIRFPNGTARGERVQTPVSLIDVAPTLLGACGLDAGALPGQDLGAALRRGGLEPRPVFAVSYGGQAASGVAAFGPKRAVVEGRWKLIHSLIDDQLELYDILDDPREQRDESAAHPDVAQRLRDLAAQALAGEAAQAEPALTPEMLEKLKALGYVD